VPEYVSCSLCGRDDPKLLFRLRDYRLQVDETEWNVVRCRFRGLGYVNPRPSRDEISVITLRATSRYVRSTPLATAGSLLTSEETEDVAGPWDRTRRLPARDG
jgi:hypothetical protein